MSGRNVNARKPKANGKASKKVNRNANRFIALPSSSSGPNPRRSSEENLKKANKPESSKRTSAFEARRDRALQSKEDGPAPQWQDNDEARSELASYIESLLDPWSHVKAKQPSRSDYPSSAVHVKQEFEITTDAEGNFMFIVSDDMDRFLCRSTIPCATGGAPQLIYGAGTSDNPKWGIRAPANNMDHGKNRVLAMWDGVTEADALKETFASFRTVSLGVSMTYMDSVVEAKGRYVAGYFNPQLDVPYQTDPTDFSIVAGVRWQDLLERESSTTYSALDDCTILWKPLGTEITEYRPTHIVATNTITTMFPDKEALTCSARADSTATKLLLSLANIGAFADNPEVMSGSKVARSFDHILGADSPALFVAGHGFKPNSVVYNVEVVWNFEAIADERSLDFGTSPNPVTQAKMENAQQLAPDLAAAAPVSIKGYRPGDPQVANEIVDATIAGVEESENSSFLDSVSSVVSTVGDVAEFAGTVAALFL
jgi:hypothetical protein